MMNIMRARTRIMESSYIYSNVRVSLVTGVFGHTRVAQKGRSNAINKLDTFVRYIPTKPTHMTHCANAIMLCSSILPYHAGGPQSICVCVCVCRVWCNLYMYVQRSCAPALEVDRDASHTRIWGLVFGAAAAAIPAACAHWWAIHQSNATRGGPKPDGKLVYGKGRRCCFCCCWWCCLCGYWSQRHIHSIYANIYLCVYNVSHTFAHFGVNELNNIIAMTCGLLTTRKHHSQIRLCVVFIVHRFLAGYERDIWIIIVYILEHASANDVWHKYVTFGYSI